MVIRTDGGVPRHYSDEHLDALEKVSGAPRWLCALAWDEALAERRSALDLLKRLAPAFPPTREEAEAALGEMGTPRRSVVDEGRAAARNDLQAGRYYTLGAGLLRDPASVCPRCVIRIPWSARTDRCAVCDTPLLHPKSLGCMIGPRTRPFLDGYRAEVDAWLRERFPGFSWEALNGRSTPGR